MSTRMLVNYAPGEECRIAVLEDGKLEEFNAERFDAISRVGNIYTGIVQNIEPAIQAAFVDFGVPDHGFLHVTDLHPQYFPGEDEETTERVGVKIRRRDRPPIQQCLKRGQRIFVQVLKEGVGTKGPTLTSYISIPGRYLVMMPQMDRVGVSRKVEDEDQRRAMRQILDQLDLPEGYGFILRTAGFDRNKTELKRDLAYLQRLWKDLEKRQGKGKAPRLLYSESDLLVRTLRDSLHGDIDQVVIDNEQALNRASEFLRIAAPRSRPPLFHYDAPTPIFHAFGVEEQIANMKAREVPLPSGGRLVFDEAEALVAIDVNSGRSRQARDAETNAYKTNLEATDEICRQLRLRDMGGLVICDLIDMRESRHRRGIEQRFRERLKRDRARSMILPISNFGILEMTRQRMRASHESTHFSECPACHGRGVVQRPSSVADDALRSLAALLAHERVARAEVVVSPRVAGQFLSGRRSSLSRLEHTSKRPVDVRISETVAPSSFVLYAYDENGADIEVDSLPALKTAPEAKAWTQDSDERDWAVDVKDEADEAIDHEAQAAARGAEAPEQLHPIELDEEEEPKPKKKRRRRRRSRKKAGDVASSQEPESAADGANEEPAPEPEPAEAPSGTEEPSQDGEQPKKKKRRRRRKKKTASAEGAQGAQEGAGEPGQGPEQPPEQAEEAPAPPDADQGPAAQRDDGAAGAQGKKKRRRRRKKKTSTGETAEAPEPTTGAEEPKSRNGRHTKAKGRRGTPAASESADEAKPPSPPSTDGEQSSRPAPPEKRFLYSGRRRISPGGKQP